MTRCLQRILNQTASRSQLGARCFSYARQAWVQGVVPDHGDAVEVFDFTGSTDSDSDFNRFDANQVRPFSCLNSRRYPFCVCQDGVIDPSEFAAGIASPPSTEAPPAPSEPPAAEPNQKNPESCEKPHKFTRTAEILCQQGCCRSAVAAVSRGTVHLRACFREAVSAPPTPPRLQLNCGTA